MSTALIVFAKSPTPGAVKTRLTTVLTEEEAGALYGAFLEDALEQYETLSADVRLYLAMGRPDGNEVVSAVNSPSPSEHDGARKAAGQTWFVQKGDGLGERMLRAFAETFAAGYDRIAIVGTDHPTLPSEFIEKAFDLLEEPLSVVVGPAADGGYYLLGMNDLRPELFRNMTYSHAGVFDETMDRAARMGASVAVLPPWYDVDTPGDLARLAAELREAEDGPSRTRAVLKQLGDRYEAFTAD